MLGGVIVVMIPDCDVAGEGVSPFKGAGFSDDDFIDSRIGGADDVGNFVCDRDFVGGFAESLSLLDELILLDIYPARELPIEGVTSKIIFDKVKSNNKTLCRKEEALDRLRKTNVEVLLTLGAGDIDQLIEPIKNFLSKQL